MQQNLSRASFYRQPSGENPENLELMRVIDEAFMEMPWYSSRQMARHLRRQGWGVGRKRVRRLMRKIGLSPIYHDYSWGWSLGKPGMVQPIYIWAQAT